MTNPQKTVLALEKKKGFGKLRKSPQGKQWRRRILKSLKVTLLLIWYANWK